MRRVVALVLLALLAMPALGGTAAAGWRQHPTIHQGQAERFAGRFLRKSYPGWRHRTVGYLDCRNGRVNRYIWSCAVGWVSGYTNCWRGRIRVTNEEIEDGTIYARVNSVTRRC